MREDLIDELLNIANVQRTYGFVDDGDVADVADVADDGQLRDEAKKHNYTYIYDDHNRTEDRGSRNESDKRFIYREYDKLLKGAKGKFPSYRMS